MKQSDLFDTPERRVVDRLSVSAQERFLENLGKPLKPAQLLEKELERYRSILGEEAKQAEFLDLRTAKLVERKCNALLDRFEESDAKTKKLIQAAILYFVEPDDAEDDIHSPIGFDDDLEVVDAVARELGLDEIVEMKREDS